MKVIIFDMYGVILEESMGNFKPYTYEYFPDTEFNIFRENYMKAEMGLISSDELLTETGFKDTAFHMKNYLENLLTVDKEFIKFAEKYHKKYKLALLSNGISEWHKHIMEYYDLKKYFDCEVVSADVRCRKPDKTIYEILIKKLNIPVEECIYIDNGIRNTLTATSLGIDSILFNRDNKIIDNKVFDGKIVSSFGEIDDILENELD